MKGYKFLRADGSSLREEGRVQYDLSGAWQTVGGNGCYLAHTGGLLASGVGPLVAELEGEGEVFGTCPPEGVRTWRRVRVLRTGGYDIIPPEPLRVVCSGEHEHGDASPATLYVGDAMVHQNGGYCYARGYAVVHQSGGYCDANGYAVVYQSSGYCYARGYAVVHQ